MHDNITTRIIEYLQLDTSYAIILNGNYGVGKTHYIKTELFPEIKKVKIKGCNDKYKPVLVSLFGAKTIEDIQDRIFIALYSLLGKKVVKLAGSLGAVVMNRFGFNARDIKNAVRESKESSTDYSKILICIDDIDRKSTELDLAEVLGFVNNLVENFNAKVLLITNEDKLRSELEAKPTEADDYSMLKEKVIGVTMTFSADTSSVIDEIIKSKYEKEEKSYFDFLTKHKDVINQRISQNEGNLRNLLFFLEHFKIIYIKSEKLLSEDEKYREIKDKVLEDILEQALPVSIEYKMGELHDGNFEEIKNQYRNIRNFLGNIDFLNSKKNSDSEKSKKEYYQIYQEKYFFYGSFNAQLKYYDSVFDYMVGSSDFTRASLKEELDLIYRFEGNEIPKREEVLNKLSYWQFLDLSYEEYRDLTEEMLSYVDKGEYALNQYVNIFHLATRYDILGYDLKDLEGRFKEGINKGKARHKYIIDYKFSEIKVDRGGDQLSKIDTYCKQVNKEMKEKEEREELLCLFKDFQDNPMEFFDRIDNESPRRKLLTVLSEFDFDDFWQVINKAKNKELIKLGYYLANTSWSNLSTGNASEKKLLVDLKEKLSKEKNESTTDIMAKVTYGVLAKTIDEVLEKQNK